MPIERTLTILHKLKQLFIMKTFRIYILIMFFGTLILNGCSKPVVLTPVSTPYNAKTEAKLNSSNIPVSVSTPYNAEAILSQTIQLKQTSKKNMGDTGTLATIVIDLNNGIFEVRKGNPNSKYFDINQYSKY